MAEPRTQHPFYMYEEILAQPDAARTVLAEQSDAVSAIAAELRDCQRLFVVGTGTSYHAAACTAWLARLEGVPLPTAAVSSFDFATYPLALTARDAVAVISHRGTKTYTGKALEAARAAGALSILVTGQGSHEAPTGVRVVRTCHQDRSPAHTVSYTSALTVLAQLLAEVAASPLLRAAVAEIPQRLRDALATDSAVRRLAEQFADRQRIYFVGGGPHAITASEAALKVKETSYVVSEGFAVEQMLHGPMQAVDAADLIVAITPSGPSTARVVDLLNAAAEIGAARVAILAEGSDALPCEATIRVPATRESLSPFVSVVPLQLFTYYSALARRRNPDAFRLDDPRYKQAASRMRL